MTVNVREVVTDALEEIIVQTSEYPISASDGKKAIRALNDMMTSWDAKGINLGYTIVSDMKDEVTVPRGAILGIKKNLAISLAKSFDEPVTDDLRIEARDGLRTIISISIGGSTTEYPCTLPQGSGNTYPGYADNKFYPEQESTILTETGGSIGLEEDT
jgi:hypothetical protein